MKGLHVGTQYLSWATTIHVWYLDGGRVAISASLPSPDPKR